MLSAKNCVLVFSAICLFACAGQKPGLHTDKCPPCPELNCDICPQDTVRVVIEPAIEKIEKLPASLHVAIVDVDSVYKSPQIVSIINKISQTPEWAKYKGISPQDTAKAKILKNQLARKARGLQVEAATLFTKKLTDNFASQFNLILDNKGNVLFPYDPKTFTTDLGDILVRRVVLNNEPFDKTDITEKFIALLQ